MQKKQFVFSSANKKYIQVIVLSNLGSSYIWYNCCTEIRMPQTASEKRFVLGSMEVRTASLLQKKNIEKLSTCKIYKQIVLWSCISPYRKQILLVRQQGKGEVRGSKLILHDTWNVVVGLKIESRYNLNIGASLVVYPEELNRC